jgi:hypothetical protein
MNCCECGKEMRLPGTYSWKDEYLGSFSINCAEEYHCCDCENELLNFSLMLKIEDEEQKRIEQLLLNSVDCNMEKFKSHLMGSESVEYILGKSVKEDGRIRTLIFQVIIRGIPFYWKESVQLFKETGDGRFKLTNGIKATDLNRDVWKNIEKPNKEVSDMYEKRFNELARTLEEQEKG